MEISSVNYKRYFEGFRLLDCVVRNRDILCFVVMQDYGEKKPKKIEVRIISCFLDEPEEARWAKAVLYNFTRMSCAAAIRPKDQFVGVEADGTVYVIGSGESGLESKVENWETNGPNRGGIRKAKTIKGKVYICGGGRSVGRRDEKGVWFSHTQSIPELDTSDQGFDDLDGFSESDIYCVGGPGEVFHYNGNNWKQCAFPSNIYLESVCCAGDGFVYIGAQSGNIFKGKGDSWKQIHKDKMTLPFKDMVWHQGKVWCTSDYGLWVIEGDKLVEADVPTEVRACAGNLSVADGVMLLAGIFGAAYHDGTQWHMLVATQK